MVLSPKKNTKRSTIIIPNSVYSDMGETVLALDSTATTSRGSSSDITIELHPAVVFDKGVDYKLALISSKIWYSWYNIKQKTIRCDTTTVQLGGNHYSTGFLRHHRLELRNQRTGEIER